MNKLKITKCIIYTKKWEERFEFDESVVFFAKNGDGKSLLFGALVRPFGLAINLKGTELNEPTSYIKTTVMNTDTKESITLCWSNRGLKKYWYEYKDEVSEISNFSQNADFICNILGLNFTQKMKKEFGKSFWSQTLVQQGAQFVDGLVPTYAKGTQADEVFYSLWANSFIDYFNYSDTLNQINELEKNIKTNNKTLTKVNEELKVINKISLDDIENEVDEKIKNAENLVNQLNEKTNKYQGLLSKRQLLNLLDADNKKYEESKKIFSEYYIEWKGAKITFADFIEEVETDKNISKEKSQINYDISNLKNEIEKINFNISETRKDLKKIHKDRFIFIHNDYDKVKSKISELNQTLQNSKEYLNTKRESKKAFLSQLEKGGSEMISALTEEGHKIQKLNKTGDYKWFKIRTDSEVGFESINLWLRANVYVNKNHHVITPYMLDASDEFSDEENLPKFINSIKELSKNNQVIITTHDEKVKDSLKQSGWKIKTLQMSEE